MPARPLRYPKAAGPETIWPAPTAPPAEGVLFGAPPADGAAEGGSAEVRVTGDAPSVRLSTSSSNGALVRPVADSSAGRLGGTRVVALAYGEGTVDLWSLDAERYDRRLHVDLDAYRALGEVAVAPDAVHGIVFSPKVALVT